MVEGCDGVEEEWRLFSFLSWSWMGWDGDGRGWRQERAGDVSTRCLEGRWSERRTRCERQSEGRDCLARTPRLGTVHGLP